MKTPTCINTLKEECNKRIIYNKESGLFTWKYNRVKGKIGKPLGSISHGYMAVSLTINGKRNNYLLHRIAWLMVYGYWPKMIDHINGIKHDNRIDNLRECDVYLNSANQGPSIRSSTGIRGVYPCWNGGYISKILYKGKNIHIGMFKCKYEAGREYDKKMIELHGEFARTNGSQGLLKIE